VFLDGIKIQPYIYIYIYIYIYTAKTCCQNSKILSICCDIYIYVVFLYSSKI
jgi:hypothetical protein